VIKYSDLQIAQLINEPKPLPLDWYSKIQTKTYMTYETKSFDVKGIRNNTFRVIWRQSIINQLDFSAIFGVIPINATKPFRLKRYDGKVSPHSNPIEKERFHDFHIHIATERYQVFGTREEDKYAEVTDRFSDLTGAIQCLLEDCNFQLPETSQLSLL
jgi:hypothetical protein